MEQEIVQNSQENDRETILSVCWDSGELAAVYYDLNTLELHIVQEVADHRPDYPYMRCLFRQVEPSYLVAAGANVFLEELLEFMSVEDGDVEKYMVRKSKMANADKYNLTFYTFDRKHPQKLEDMRRKILGLDLPGLAADSSKHDREIFINSALPMQDLFVIALANLLRYLSENSIKWRHVFVDICTSPLITNVLLSLIESQVLLDDMTFNSLNIFSNIYHPSSFKIQVRKDGLSLYNLLNQCSSSNGSRELKNILKQPTNNINELNMRLATVEWCLSKENADHLQKIQHSLGGFVNVNAVFQRILKSHGKSSDWKALLRTVYSALSICQLCASLQSETIEGTILKDLAEYAKHDISVNSVMAALGKVVDVDAIEEKKRFQVKKGIDTLLDQKIESLTELTEKCENYHPDDTLLSLNDSLENFQFVFFSEMGFAVGTTLKLDQLNLSLMAESGIELLLQTDSAIFFKTKMCEKLNKEYDDKLTEIITHEVKIFNKLIAHIHENFAEITEITKICAKLDCLIAFSTVAAKHRYVKPQLSEERTISIVNGRHPLVEQIKEYVTNDTDINQRNKHFVNIIRAPNSSGKSIYMKQVALIAYLAHIGCYVPCDACNICLLHSIHTRIYTPESITSNESAFMSDIQQMSKVVMNSTPRSLILIDEFGKGTHFRDGIALLTATLEHFIERGAEITPFVFVTTHYPQVYNLLRTKELVALKTISTAKNTSNVFESSFKVVDGTNEQICTEYPESHSIISNIFNRNEEQKKGLARFNNCYRTSVKAFILVMARMKMRKGVITREFLDDMYTKLDIENFFTQ